MKNLLPALALTGLAILGSVSARAEDGVREHQIKAAFLYNFAKFIEWPENAFAAGNAALEFGSFCGDDFNAELATIVKERKINAHPLRVRAMTTPQDAASVQVVFVCREQEMQFPAVRRATSGRPILLVGESQAARDGGAAINFVVVDDKVRFEIRVDGAERASLKVSAQLQKLAVGVGRAQ